MQTGFMAKAGDLAARWFRGRGAARAAALVLLGIAPFAVVVSWSERAFAQASGTNTNTTTITIDQPNISRQIPGQTGYYDYRDSRKWWISRQDCLNDEVFNFPLTLSKTTSPLEVWAGKSNCAQLRANAEDHEQCWLVASVARPTDNPTVTVPVRNVVLRDLSGDVVPMGVSEDVCEKLNSPSNGEAVTFYFMVVDGGISVGSATWDGMSVGGTGYDLIGPEPPGSIAIGVGESQLTLQLNDLPEDTERDSFQAFCVPEGTRPDFVPDVDPGAGGSANAGAAGSANAGAAGSANAGAAGSAGSGGTPAPADCFTSVAVGGIRPPSDSPYACGTAPTTARVLNTSRLSNGVDYAVGVAARDILGNTGNLSNLQCGTPILMDDFFEVYSRNGGPGGGGGLCSMAPGLSRFSPVAAWVGSLALLALAVRRQRSAA